jgi:hypothetical protein
MFMTGHGISAFAELFWDGLGNSFGGTMRVSAHLTRALVICCNASAVFPDAKQLLWLSPDPGGFFFSGFRHRDVCSCRLLERTGCVAHFGREQAHSTSLAGGPVNNDIQSGFWTFSFWMCTTMTIGMQVWW